MSCAELFLNSPLCRLKLEWCVSIYQVYLQWRFYSQCFSWNDWFCFITVHVWLIYKFELFTELLLFSLYNSKFRDLLRKRHNLQTQVHILLTQKLCNAAGYEALKQQKPFCFCSKDNLLKRKWFCECCYHDGDQHPQHPWMSGSVGHEEIKINRLTKWFGGRNSIQSINQI